MDARGGRSAATQLSAPRSIVLRRMRSLVAGRSSARETRYFDKCSFFDTTMPLD